MIGEEIFAASCYLKPEPVMLGTIKGEDFIRLWLIIITAAVVLFGTVATILSHSAPGLTAYFETIVRWATPAY